uniref:Uncharacterized protein n=1 Tax=Anguilla anguilla TaxID=7936 RepID=A0A0E9RTH1_ANGAN
MPVPILPGVHNGDFLVIATVEARVKVQCNAFSGVAHIDHETGRERNTHGWMIMDEGGKDLARL